MKQKSVTEVSGVKTLGIHRNGHITVILANLTLTLSNRNRGFLIYDPQSPPLDPAYAYYA